MDDIKGERCSWCGWHAREDETICCKCGHSLLGTNMQDSTLFNTPNIKPRATVYGPPSPIDKNLKMLRSTVYGPPSINSRAMLYGAPIPFRNRIRIRYASLIIIILLLLIVIVISYIYFGK